MNRATIEKSDHSAPSETKNKAQAMADASHLAGSGFRRGHGRLLRL